MGRNPSTFAIYSTLMAEMQDKLVVIDADGLFWVHDCPSAAVITPQLLEAAGSQARNLLFRFLPYGTKHTILTPNEIELYRLVKRFVKPNLEVGELTQISVKLHEHMQKSPGESRQLRIFSKTELVAVCPELQLLFSLLGDQKGITLLAKGLVDIIIAGDRIGVVNTQAGLKRCGGQGDILAGLVGLYGLWDLEGSRAEQPNSVQQEGPAETYPLHGVLLASVITREASRRAFEQWGYSTTSKKVLDYLPYVIKDIVI